MGGNQDGASQGTQAEAMAVWGSESGEYTTTGIGCACIGGV